MTGSGGMRGLITWVTVVAFIGTTMGCGTILYPERRGQPAGKLDTDIVILDYVEEPSKKRAGDLLRHG